MLQIVAIIACAALILGYLSWKFKQLEKKQEAVPTAENLAQGFQGLGLRFDNTLQTVGDLRAQLGTMQGIAKDVTDLRLTFYSAKLRGNFGERVLNDMLENSFPKEHFALQHKFRDGQVVDAVVKTRDGIICIDSKFPIENYRKMVSAGTDAEREFETREFRKAVKKHITDISNKYILPAEGTMDVAVMYVPSEAVFYEIISGSDDLVQAAESNHVLMTSPNTMSYFLHVLRMGYERIRIEENVQKVWEQVAGLEQDFDKFGDNLRQLWTHINNAKNKADAVGNEFTKLAGKVEQLKKQD